METNNIGQTLQHIDSNEGNLEVNDGEFWRDDSKQ